MSMLVYLIASGQETLSITGFNSLEDATRHPAPEGVTHYLVRDKDEVLALTDDVLLRAYNFKKVAKKPLASIKDEKVKKKVAASLWALLQHKDEPAEPPDEKELTSSEEGNTNAATGGDDASNQTQEAEVATKKRKSTKKAKAAKAARKTASGNPRGEKTLKVKALLERKSGCTREDILEATGWPAVSVPAMAKACGLKLRKEKQEDKPGKPMRYFGTAA